MKVEAAPLWRPGDGVEALRALLARGGVLGIPTESSYGLAVDPRSVTGVGSVYAIKERERGKPLPVVGADLAQLAALGLEVTLPPCSLAARVWPAALTVVAPLREQLPAAAGTGSLAVRIPRHRLLRELLGQLGTGVTATSANRSGTQPLLEAQAVAALLGGRDAVVVDAGTLPGGPPSTLVEWAANRWRVLRHGGFPVSELPAADSPGLRSPWGALE